MGMHTFHLALFSLAVVRIFSSQLLAEDTVLSAVVGCCIFPALCVDVQDLHVTLSRAFMLLPILAKCSTIDLSQNVFLLQNS